MTQEERQQFNQMRQQLETLKDLFYKGDFPDKKIFYKTLVAQGGLSLAGSPISIGTTSGVIGLYGETPVVQAGAITSPSGGATVDSQARTAIASIITALANIGITA